MVKKTEGAPQGAKTTVEMLHEIAARYNREGPYNHHWYVAREANGDGTFHHRLDCNEGAR